VSLQGVREFFDNRNIVIIMLTQTLSMFLAWLWWPYKSLFILELGATNEILGLLVMVETLGGMFFQIPGGVLADRYGRKRVIIAAAVLSFGTCDDTLLRFIAEQGRIERLDRGEPANR
jgi:MFS family permease